IAPDLRGHGASPTPHGPWSIDDFASDVARLTAAEGGGAILVGIGLGAAAGLALALGHPGLVDGLVVSGVGPRGEDTEGQDRW
ncbi:alpha/beta hydrolase, partial [Klebsiella pneumoniae]|nr:alpha/beta hydrolase [Klebsiella pneumoniae]